jgi:hypothetical protein
MSINPVTQYPGKVAPATPDNPFGTARNITIPGDGTGTPWESALLKDEWALQHAMLLNAGMEPNGTPDSAENSQLFKAAKASIGNGANLLSNHNFLTPSPYTTGPGATQPPPDATPRSYPPGFQIFSGVFVNETTGITDLTYINGRPNWSAGDFYMSVPNTGAIERVNDFVASVADFDGKPRTRGVSYALVGDEYRVTVGVDALEDASAVLTPLGSVKLEQGGVATGHEVGEEITTTTLSSYADVTYKASGTNSAVENMLSGIPLRSSIGDYCNAAGTLFRHNSGDGTDLSHYTVVGDIFADSFGATPDFSESNVTDSWQALTDALEYAQSKLIATVRIEGDYGLSKPLVIPASVWLVGGNVNTTSLTKYTNTTSGLPPVNGYGGELIMDVDAAVIIGTGYQSGLHRMKVQCWAPTSVEYGIYHGITRECSIELVRVGKPDLADGGKRLFLNGVTAEQGFFHSYKEISMYCKLRGWNYRFSENSLGCNTVTCNRSYVVYTSDKAALFEGTTGFNLGNIYVEESTGGILRVNGAAACNIDVLCLDRHTLDNSSVGIYIRNSQVNIGNLSPNVLDIATGESATFIELSNSGGIYTDLYLGGTTAKTASRNLPGVTTLVKGGDSEVFFRGAPLPPIGEFGNIGGYQTDTWSALEDTGNISTFHQRSVSVSQESEARGIRSNVDCSLKSIADLVNTKVTASTFVKPGQNYEHCGGFAGSSGPISNASSANRKWSLDSLNGNIYGTGTVAGGHTFSDFAEYFENADQGVIPLGTLVDLNGEKIAPANGDEFIGVVSGTAGFILNEARISWSGRYLVGEYGEPIWEGIEDSEGNTVTVRKENPDYSPERERLGFDDEGNEILGEVIYSSRSERPEEWSCVGLTGQVYVSVDESVCVGDYLTAANGVGFKSEVKTQCRVMKKTSKSIAKCLIK